MSVERKPTRRQCDVLYAASRKLWEALHKLKERGYPNDQGIIDDLLEAKDEVDFAMKLRR